MSIEAQPVIDIEIILHARSDAKYCITVDMANTTIDGASELEVGKNSNLAFG